jgi:hypothetical protein
MAGSTASRAKPPKAPPRPSNTSRLRFALADVRQAAFCEHCKNPVFARAVYGPDTMLRKQARRGWVVLTDTMYVVHGPDGEPQVCRPCVERCVFRRDEGEDWESLPNAGDF